MSAQPPAPEPEFSTVEEADRAFFGDSYNPDDPEDGNDGQDGKNGTQWGELQPVSTDWLAGWTLVYQEATNEQGVRRWFVIRTSESGQFQALTMTGQANDYDAEQSLAELPSTRSESEARQAYQTWVDENDPESEDGDDQGGDDQGDESSQWGEWTKLNQAGDWTLWGRDHKQEDRSQFILASKTSDGTPVYLQPDGTVGTEPHQYTSMEAVQQALDAYETRKQNGEIPEGQRPTGNSPSRSTINRSTNVKQGGPLGAAVEAVGGTTNAVLLGGVAVAGLYYAEHEGYIDLTEQIP